MVNFTDLSGTGAVTITISFTGLKPFQLFPIFVGNTFDNSKALIEMSRLKSSERRKPFGSVRGPVRFTFYM